LLRAVASGNKAKTELVLRGGISANTKDDQGQSALIMATALPSTDIADLLIAHGADVNSRSKDGATPLMAAIITGHKDTAKLLLRKGAEVNASAPVGSPAPQQMPMLFIAIALGDIEITQLLIEEGADVTAKLSDGQQMLSPLAFALKSDRQDIAQLLMDTGAKKKPLEDHIRQLDDRLTSLCQDAGENTRARKQCRQGIWVLPREGSSLVVVSIAEEGQELSILGNGCLRKRRRDQSSSY
jgi:ankyrin repeat protein